jgi:hypothetical protein
MASSTKRPGGVTWLAAAVFLLAVANLGSVPYDLGRWPVLSALNLPFPVAVRVGLNGMWGGIGLALAWGLWRLRPWGRRLTLILFPVYEVYAVGWQLLFARGTYERGRLGFAALLALLGIAVVAYVLTRPRVKEAFKSKGRTWSTNNGE